MTFLLEWFLFLAPYLLFLTSTFLILLVLVQRGRGGGLAGALGGPGGQSAFGAKAGDTFTWITVITAACWGLLCITTILGFNWQLKPLDSDDSGIVDKKPAMGGASDKDKGSGEKGSGEKGSGEKGSGEKGSGEKDSGTTQK